MSHKKKWQSGDKIKKKKKNGWINTDDEERCGRTIDIVIEEIAEKVQELIREDCRLTVDKLIAIFRLLLYKEFLVNFCEVRPQLD